MINGTMLLIGGALVIMVVMHHVWHIGRAGSRGARDGGGSADSDDGSGLIGAVGSGVGPQADGPSGHGDHLSVGEESQAGAGQRQRKHGCC
jgi:hypothetical protein